jgi:thiol-disulfide isomerase/thioredoxin
MTDTTRFLSDLRLRIAGMIIALLALSPFVVSRITAADDKPSSPNLNSADAKDSDQSVKQNAPAETGSSKSGQETSPKKDPYAVPDGTPKELLQFIRDVLATPPAANTREELIQQVLKLTAAVMEASDRIVASPDADEETTLLAIRAKYQVLSIRVRLEDPNALKTLAEYTERLQAKQNAPEVAALARQSDLLVRVEAVSQLTREQRGRVKDDFVAFLATRPIRQSEFELAMSLTRELEMLDEQQIAVGLYEKLAEIFAKSNHPAVRSFASKMEGSVRRLRLPGNTFALQGRTVDGKKFDWTAYQGKVVLVDFWATWCGPCLADLPLILQSYRKYHDRGFEIVGISLDHEREALESFLSANAIPWTTLFSPDPVKRGWEDPIAAHYGLMGIPAAFLVDQNGKVVSISVRGENLDEALAKLLGPAKE